MLLLLLGLNGATFGQRRLQLALQNVQLASLSFQQQTRHLQNKMFVRNLAGKVAESADGGKPQDWKAFPGAEKRTGACVHIVFVFVLVLAGVGVKNALIYLLFL